MWVHSEKTLYEVRSRRGGKEAYGVEIYAASSGDSDSMKIYDPYITEENAKYVFSRLII